MSFDFEMFALCLFALISSIKLTDILFTFFVFKTAVKENQRYEESMDDSELPEVMLVMPCYNDSKTINESLAYIEKIDHPKLNVLIIDDCSTDSTRESVSEWMKQERKFSYKLVCLPTNSGNKSYAMKRAYEHFDDGIIVITDGDTYLDSKSIRELVTVKNKYGNSCSTVSGRVLIRESEEESLVQMMQRYEYEYIYAYKKLYQSYYGALVGSSGALLLTTKSDIDEYGCFDEDVLVEDVVWSCSQIAIQKKKVCYSFNAVAYTAAQPTLSLLIRQRLRWAYGTFEAVQKKHFCFPTTRSELFVFGQIFGVMIIFMLRVIPALALLFILPHAVIVYGLLNLLWFLQIIALSQRNNLASGNLLSGISSLFYILFLQVIGAYAYITTILKVTFGMKKSWSTR